MAASTAVNGPARTKALADRLFEAGLGTMDLIGVYLGDRLGYYRALSGVKVGLTSGQLARRTSTDERYTREWLEQQAVTGILEVVAPSTYAQKRRYTLPAPHAEVLTSQDSLSYLAPLARQLMAAARQLPAVAKAYKTGGGVGWAKFGPEMRESQSDFNRPFFAHQLAKECLRSIPDIHVNLSRAGARVADIACGGGWSSIAIAQAYRNAKIDGYDLDEPSVRLARRNAKQAGVADRVTFYCADAASLAHARAYDLVIICEALHDLAQPVEVLAKMRRIAGSGGAVIVVDELVAGEFTAPGDALERYFYGWSISICLPDSMSHRPTAATGTVMRPATLRKYALAAGFKDTEVLPIKTDFFRFYRLQQ